MAFRPGVKCPFVASIILAVFAIIFIALAVAWSPIFETLFRRAVIQKGSYSWQFFPSTNFPGAPVIYEQYSLYNCTNVADVLNGSAPILTEVGPFVYQYTNNKLDITFNSDKSNITYTRWTNWRFIPELSFADPMTIDITAMNPPYLGALAKAGNENALPVAYTSYIERELFKFLSTTFWKDSLVYQSAGILNEMKRGVIQDYMQRNPGLPIDVATNWFFNLWSETTTATGNATLDALSVPLSVGSLALGIQSATAHALFDPGNAKSLTYNPTSWVSGASVDWFSARSSDSINLELQQAFSLTKHQVTSISEWLNSFSYTVAILYANIYRNYNIQSPQEAACLHWGSAAYAAPSSVSTLYPSLYPNGTVEYGWFWKGSWTPSIINVTQCMTMYFAPKELKDLNDAQTFGDFIKSVSAAVLNQDVNLIPARWMVDGLYQATGILNFYVLSSNSVTNAYGAPGVKYWLSNGSGLFVTRKAGDWLWHYTDPLAIRLLPTAPPMSFKHNMSTPEAARMMSKPWTVNSGVKDITQVANTIVWNGTSTVHWYSNPLEVRGQTEDGQFPPFIDCNSARLGPWINEYAKTIYLQPIAQNVMVWDLKTCRFSPEDSTWDVNPYLGSWIQGFHNMSGKYSGSPVFLSNPHFLGVPQYWTTRVKGDPIKPSPNDMITVDIEPYTGKVVRFNRGLQVHLYIPQNTSWFTLGYHPNVYRDMMYPMMHGRMHTTAPKTLTDRITSTVYVALKLKPILQWTMVGLAIALVLTVALTVTISLLRHRKAAGYTTIQ